jgi:hypothetical protein
LRRWCQYGCWKNLMWMWHGMEIGLDNIHFWFFNTFIIFSSFLRSSTVLERTLAASHAGGFFNLFRHLVGFLWTSDQPVAKTYTYTGQQTQNDKDKCPCLKRETKPRSQRPSDIRAYVWDPATTRIGR